MSERFVVLRFGLGCGKMAHNIMFTSILVKLHMMFAIRLQSLCFYKGKVAYIRLRWELLNGIEWWNVFECYTLWCHCLCCTLPYFSFLFTLCIGYNASDSDSDEMMGEAQWPIDLDVVTLVMAFIWKLFSIGRHFFVLFLYVCNKLFQWWVVI